MESTPSPRSSGAAPSPFSQGRRCRECQAVLDGEPLVCAECGAPRPAQSEWNGEGYEWKSAATWRGWPLVHIAFGLGKDGKSRTARGVVAIGQRAVGGVAIGILAGGGVAIGVISGGVVSIGVVSLALGAAVGVNAVAPLAIGVSAFGFWVGGLEAMGWKVIFAPGPGAR